MSYKEVISNTDVDFLTDTAKGGDDLLYKKAENQYTRSISRGSKADIWFNCTVWRTTNGKKWTLTNDDHTCVWKAYSMSYYGQFDRSRADASGLSVQAAVDILNMRLIRRIQGESVDPTMFLSELDENFSMVTKRVQQAVEFLKNLKNPKRLAQLTLRYFKGTESRRTLAKRYTSAKRKFMRRTARWKTRDWTSSYLEYQFGWRPLCDDVWKLVGLAREAKRRHAQFEARVGLSPKTWSDSWHNAGPIGRDSDVASCEGSTCGHARIRFCIENPWLRQGATLEHPAYTTWDNVPYSWLVDCVVNVGEQLKYALYNSGLGLIGGYCSVLRKVNCRISIDPSVKKVGNSSTSQLSSYEARGQLTYTGVLNQRRVYHVWPAVPIFWKYANTFKNAELLSIIGAFIHQLLAKLADERRPWKPSP